MAHLLLHVCVSARHAHPCRCQGVWRLVRNMEQNETLYELFGVLDEASSICPVSQVMCGPAHVRCCAGADGTTRCCTVARSMDGFRKRGTATTSAS